MTARYVPVDIVLEPRESINSKSLFIEVVTGQVLILDRHGSAACRGHWGQESDGW